MHTSGTMRHLMHHLHDEGVKAIHHTEHLFHAKVFWVSFGILALIAIVFMLGAFVATTGPVMPYHYSVPMP